MANQLTLPQQANLSVGSLNSYIHWANQIPLLTEAEEFELAESVRKCSDLEAARRLILPHLRFVINFLAPILAMGSPADLIQKEILAS